MGQGLQRHAVDVLSADDLEIDLQVDVREWDGVTSIMTAGGRWSVGRRRWVGDGHTQAVWRLQPAEYEAGYWFCDWLEAYARGERVEGFEEIYTLLCPGGRGGGKTDFGIRAIAMLALSIPDRICWDVSPVEDETDELKRVMDSILCPHWYKWLKSELTWRFWNGSEIQLLSGYNPSSLKRGRVDGVLLNEGQRFKKAAYMMARPRVSDTSGICIVTANPPNEAKGRWITEMHDAAQAGALPGVHLLPFDNRKNPTIDWAALSVLRDEFGEDDYQREVMGVFVPIGDRVFYAWLPTTMAGNIRPAPEVGDITRDVTRRLFGREFDYIAGLDFQRAPYEAAAICKLFADPLDPLVWFVDELTVSGTEDDLCDGLESAGYDPTNTVLIGDATGDYQGSERIKGRGSFDIIRARGWVIYPPDRKMKTNPLVIERCQATNARMCSSRGQRRLFSVPENLALNTALKGWDNKNGQPNRRSRYAHLCDAASYVAWRLFPRRRIRGRIQYDAVKRKRSAREKDLQGF